mmetsp:Transcript_8307/g.19581  ORF Transcript_8307/g.19581 Transcript_8307/m.19581 type:complete len:202 (-) Transcript_8307:2405-3010(-)
MKVVKEERSTEMKSLLPCLAANLVNCCSSSSGVSSRSRFLSTAPNSAAMSVPSPDLSNWRKFFLTSAICSGEMSACARVIWASSSVILSRSSFSRTSTCDLSVATPSRVYGLSSSPASTSQSLSSCAGAMRPCRRSRCEMEVSASIAASTSLPLAIESGSSVTFVPALWQSVLTSAFSADTLAATEVTSSAKIFFLASNSF